jgi:hypothetical protein
MNASDCWMPVIAGAVLLRLSPVVRQLIREKIVSELIAQKHWASLEVSSWKFDSCGYSAAIKKEFVWGDLSRDLLKLERIRKWVLVFRAVVVTEYLLLLLVLVFIGWGR